MKVCRIHKNGAVDLKGWTKINDKLDSDEIKTIRDDLFTGNAAKVATSIPDPFARMYLFETAFKMVNSEASARGRSLYHMLVSDCLDVFQLLYMMGDGPKVSFVKWNVNSQISNLINVPNVTDQGNETVHPHRILGEALDMAIKSSRFIGFNDIYLILYEGVLIGGTSPLTVFFTSPNLMREIIRMNVDFPSTTTTDKLFDPDPAALVDRAEDFQEYMFRFWLSNKAQLAVTSPQLEEYLRKNGGKDFSDKLSISGESYNTDKFISDYLPIHTDISKTQQLFSGQYSVRQYDPGNIKKIIENNSGFVIKPSVNHYQSYKDGNGVSVNLPTPLALVSQMSHRYTYVQDMWDDSTIVEYHPDIPLHLKTLPGKSAVEYPYLTNNDFFEDKLIRMPFNLNNKNFYTGFDGTFEYLLPIKKEYFNYFTISDLKKYLSVENNHETVSFDLKIPLKSGNHISFKKVYKKNGEDSDIWAEMNANSVLGFGLGIFPFYKVTDKRELNDYSIMLVENLNNFNIDLGFYKLSNIINNIQLITKQTVRSVKSGESARNTFYRIKDNEDNSFDIIEIKYGGYNALIIPEFKEVAYNNHHEHFNFAIDFGTSNSHISYCTDNNPVIRPFDIELSNMQMVRLSERTENVQDINESFAYGTGRLPELENSTKRNFVPLIIGENSNIKYPIRTVTSENMSFATSELDLFGNINIGYFFDTEEVMLSNTLYHTNIKWGIENKPDGANEGKRVEAFFLQTLWMIKNKILMGNGTLDTNIIWFVPISMKKNAISTFKTLWQKGIDNVFGSENKIKLAMETESCAPYYYLLGKDGLFKGEDALNIDIGGGTVDVLFFAKSISKYFSTSFKFGANTIWGDGITHHENAASPKDNGFYSLVKNKLESGELQITNPDISSYYDTFHKNPIYDSADIISFLFKYDNHFNFSTTIKNSPLRILLYLHYSSIIYHIAQIINWKNIDIPSYINFTGKGSEYIKLIMLDDDELTNYTGILLNKFTGKELPKNIFKVKLANNPKEVTANGGLSKIITQGDKISAEEIVHYGFDENKVTELAMDNIEVKDLDKISHSIIENINELLDILSNDMDLKKYFNKNSLSMKIGGETLKDKVNKYMEPTIKQVIGEEKQNLDANDLVEETPFFWALRDIFYRLSKEIK